MAVVTGTCALVTIVALWGLHFVSSGRLMDRYVETTSDSILAARRTVNGLLVSVAGLIAVAVGNELVIAHPHDQASVARWPPSPTWVTPSAASHSASASSPDVKAG
jgi:low temperature requirement protein LtrA